MWRNRKVQLLNLHLVLLLHPSLPLLAIDWEPGRPSLKKEQDSVV
jgi:hypothetical protein